MKNFTIALAVAMTLMSFGCKKKSGGSNEAMAKMTEFKDKMCKCAEHDTACAQTVSDEMKKWGEEQGKNQKEPPKMSEEDQKKAAAIGEEMGKSMQKAMTPAAAAAPPAGAEGAAPAAGAEGAAPAAGAEGAATDVPASMPDCKEFVALTEKYNKCEKVAKDVRDNQLKVLEMQRASWAAVTKIDDPGDEGKKKVNEVCKQSVVDLKKSAKDAGCPL